MFDNVTILFSDVVGFTRICSQISPMEVVSMLNAMYTQFDQLSEKHNVYKVGNCVGTWICVYFALSLWNTVFVLTMTAKMYQDCQRNVKITR